MENSIVRIKKGEARAYKAGGLWIYDNEIDRVEGDPKPGSIVRVEDFDGYLLGVGFYNPRSKISIRMLSKKDEVIDREFLKNRVKRAYDYRKALAFEGSDSFRVIFGEADFLPGIVIDKYADVLAVQSLALGIDLMKNDIVDILKELFEADGVHIRGVYERSDAKVRADEGLEPFKGYIGEEFDTDVIITENNVRYHVDVKDGQKTGFFLDQKLNRRAVGELARGLEVLDCFTHTGSFALNCGICGAKKVTGVDVSQAAVDLARENAKLNGLEGTVDFVCEDVMDLLPRLVREKREYDMVILDPPAFTKSRASVKNAMKGYRQINMEGMKLVKDGGFLVTCSCSHFMPEDLFKTVISQAAKAVHRRVRQVRFMTQAPDHPILWDADESSYLKLFILQLYA